MVALIVLHLSILVCVLCRVWDGNACSSYMRLWKQPSRTERAETKAMKKKKEKKQKKEEREEEREEAKEEEEH